MSRLLPGALGQTPGLFTGPRPQAWPPLPPRRPAPPVRPPSAQASRLPGAAAGGQVPDRPRRRRRRRPGKGRERGHHGCGRPGPAGEGADEGRSRAASGPPALGALEAQIIQALEREAESGSRRRRRKSQRFIAFAPHLPGAPLPPSPTTRSRAAAARAPEAAGPAGAETTAPSLPRALPPLAAPPPPPRARPRAGAPTMSPCCPTPTPPPAPPRPAGLAASTAAARRSSWRDPDVVGQELRRVPVGGGGAVADDATALPSFSHLGCLAAGAPG